MWRRSREDNQPWLEARMRHTPDDDLGFFRDVLMQKCDVWVLAEGGTALGLLALHDGFIEQLYVEPKAQRSGVGGALMRHAKSLFPAGLALYTHQKNRRARAFYEAAGFRVAAFGTSPPPECEPDVRYAWAPGAK